LSFLYATYEPQCWWFEVFETLRRLVLTAGVSFFKPGTAVQIIFSIILSLGSMRVYSGFKPFIDEKLDLLSELMQWQMIFTMLGALALKVDLVGENLDDVKMFDTMLVLLQFVGPSIAFVAQFLDEGVIEGMIYMVRGARREAKQKDEEVGTDIETPGGGIEMRPMGGYDDSGDRLRAQSTGETGLGGDVVSKHEKYGMRAAEGELARKQARMNQLKGIYSNTKNLKTGGSGVGGVEKKIEIEIEPKPKSEWDKIWDEKEGEFYYQNSRTLASSWDDPEGL